MEVSPNLFISKNRRVSLLDLCEQSGQNNDILDHLDAMTHNSRALWSHKLVTNTQKDVALKESIANAKLGITNSELSYPKRVQPTALIR